MVYMTKFGIFYLLALSSTVLCVRSAIDGRNSPYFHFPTYFRRFWSKVIELATLEKAPDDFGEVFYEASENLAPNANDIDPQLNPANIPAFAIKELSLHIKNANPLVFRLMLKQESRTELLKAAGLDIWVDAGLKYLPLDIADIIDRFWLDSLNQFEKKSLRAVQDKFAWIPKILEYVPNFMGHGLADVNLITNIDAKMVSLISTIRFLLKSEQLDIRHYFNIKELLLDPGFGIDLTNLAKPMQTLFDEAVIKYFGEADLSMKGRIVSGILNLTPDQSRNRNEVLLAVMNRVGPAMQKLMQMFGNEAHSGELKRTLDRLKDSIEPMSTLERNKVISDAFGGIDKWNLRIGKPVWKKPYYEMQLDNSIRTKGKLVELTKRVGAASVGEGWIGKMQFHSDDEPIIPVFIKLMRWDISSRLEKEILFLERIQAEHAHMASIIDELIASLREELDFSSEFANQLLGVKAYDFENTHSNTNIIHVPKPIGVYSGSGSAALVMKFEHGRTLKEILADDSLTPEYACKAVDLVKELIRRWLKVLLMSDDAFGHGDLHPGNIMMVFHPKVEYSYLTLLDWGNVIKISPKIQKLLKTLFVGIFAREDKMILRGLGYNKNVKGNPQWNALLVGIDKIFNKMDQSKKQKRKNARDGECDYIDYGEDEQGEDLTESTFEVGSVGHQLAMYASEFTLSDELFHLLDNVVSSAINNNVPIPRGTASFLRARKFLESILLQLAAHPSVKKAKCKVPRPSPAFCFALLKVDNVLAGLKSTPTVLKTYGTKFSRKLQKKKQGNNHPQGNDIQ